MCFVFVCARFRCCRSFFFFFKQKTAYEMRISDWSSDVCSSDLYGAPLSIVQAVVDVNAVRKRAMAERIETACGGVRGATLAVQIGRASCRERVCQYV